MVFSNAIDYLWAFRRGCLQHSFKYNLDLVWCARAIRELGNVSPGKPALDSIADEIFESLIAPRETSPFTERFPEFDLSDSYKIVEEMRRRREAGGERVVGRKIGFTNASAWAGYGISGPIWNYLYDKTTFDLALIKGFAIGSWPNVRMETEVALGLSQAPDATMDEAGLLRCIEWVALDFEICASIFPDWKFKAADAAATGVHVALLIGKRHSIEDDPLRWSRQLESFTARLSEAAGAHAVGGGGQVLGSPIKALGHLVREMARYGAEPLRAGEIVTTGTLTRALPARSGEHWRASTSGIPFSEIEVRLI
jgi:2-keto-4-pentenoate hydratase